MCAPSSRKGTVIAQKRTIAGGQGNAKQKKKGWHEHVEAGSPFLRAVLPGKSCSGFPPLGPSGKWCLHACIVRLSSLTTNFLPRAPLLGKVAKLQNAGANRLALQLLIPVMVAFVRDLKDGLGHALEMIAFNCL